MSKKYINAEAFERKVMFGDEEDVQDVIYSLRDFPAADVEEVRHGEWNQNPHCKRIYFCSECGRHIEDGSFRPYENFPYCHCGAKMRKENEQ